mmetsp:Transcript_18441/g.30027  ORF Transcript_18441/g.30027 Transcript_18441/m.30027 type:complete len:88 (+) Transcript_18441:3210-3473(+)
MQKKVKTAPKYSPPTVGLIENPKPVPVEEANVAFAVATNAVRVSVPPIPTPTTMVATKNMNKLIVTQQLTLGGVETALSGSFTFLIS